LRRELFVDDPYFRDWVEAQPKSNRRQRRWALRLFCEFVGKSPGELISERVRDLKSDDPYRRVWAENALRRFMAKLRDEGSGYCKMKNIYYSVRNFYDFWGVPLNLKRGDAPRGESGDVFPVTKDEIRRVLEVADAREAAIVLLMKDSGLAVKEVADLRLKHLGSDGENLSLEDVPIPIVLSRSKTRSQIMTFIGPEAVEALNAYWDLRRRGTSAAYKGFRYEGKRSERLTGESPVIASERGVGKPVSAMTLTHLLTRLFRKAGITRPVSSHSFRRFFKTMLEHPDVGIQPAWIKRMMGHRLTSLEKAYSHPTPEDLREAYRRAIPFLSVKSRPADIQRVRQLEEELEKERQLRIEYEARLMRVENILQEVISIRDYLRRRRQI